VISSSSASITRNARPSRALVRSSARRGSTTPRFVPTWPAPFASRSGSRAATSTVHLRRLSRAPCPCSRARQGPGARRRTSSRATARRSWPCSSVSGAPSERGIGRVQVHRSGVGRVSARARRARALRHACVPELEASGARWRTRARRNPASCSLAMCAGWIRVAFRSSARRRRPTSRRSTRTRGAPTSRAFSPSIRRSRSSLAAANRTQIYSRRPSGPALRSCVERALQRVDQRGACVLDKMLAPRETVHGVLVENSTGWARCCSGRAASARASARSFSWSAVTASSRTTASSSRARRAAASSDPRSRCCSITSRFAGSDPQHPRPLRSDGGARGDPRRARRRALPLGGQRSLRSPRHRRCASCARRRAHPLLRIPIRPGREMARCWRSPRANEQLKRAGHHGARRLRRAARERARRDAATASSDRAANVPVPGTERRPRTPEK